MGLKKAEHNAADNEWIAQCFGCGYICVKRVDDTRIGALAL
jgi:uncharacterized cysteine cluster protein YcgN (CxxCxxCC family)